MRKIKCPRCLNDDPEYFYSGSKGVYCRRCVAFKRILLSEDLNPLQYDVSEEASNYEFNYELTAFQKEASKSTLSTLLKNMDVLLHCVCGAGKTEIVVESISYFLAQQKRVCYAISRREVVVELALRFKQVFKSAKVTAVYGGHHDEIIGDFIICTTHQLFRYYKTFDLLIIDEVDAFPLSGNETLMNIAFNSCRGNIVFSTATINEFLLNCLKKRKYEEVKLYVRPSLKPLCVPRLFYGISLTNILLMYFLMKKEDEQMIIFVSSKKTCRFLYLLFSKIFLCTYVYSDLEKRNENIMAFKNKEYKYIFATSVLERGITLKGVSVILYFDRKDAFDKSAIIQMSGRVGRGVGVIKGNAYILANYRSKQIDESIEEIREANKYLEMSIL